MYRITERVPAGKQTDAVMEDVVYRAVVIYKRRHDPTARLVEQHEKSYVFENSDLCCFQIRAGSS